MIIIHSAQAFLVIYFSRLSWFYTDVLVFELFYLIVFKKCFLKIRYYHMITWSLNTILQFLPYKSGLIYGNDDIQGGMIRCSLATGSGTAELATYWMFYTFHIELILSFVLIVLFSVITISYCYYMSRKDVTNMYMLPKIRSTWSTLILYPVGINITFFQKIILLITFEGMLIAWLPNAFYAVYFNIFVVKHHHPPDNGLVIVNYFHLSNAFYGVLLSLIFYTKTDDAIVQWKLVFHRLLSALNNKGSIESSISFEERPTVNVTKETYESNVIRETYHSTKNNNLVSNPIINIA